MKKVLPCLYDFVEKTRRNKHNKVTKKYNKQNKNVASKNKEFLRSSQYCTWIPGSFIAFVACDAGLAVFRAHGSVTC